MPENVNPAKAAWQLHTDSLRRELAELQQIYEQAAQDSPPEIVEYVQKHIKRQIDAIKAELQQIKESGSEYVQ